MSVPGIYPVESVDEKVGGGKTAPQAAVSGSHLPLWGGPVSRPHLPLWGGPVDGASFPSNQLNRDPASLQGELVLRVSLPRPTPLQPGHTQSVADSHTLSCHLLHLSAYFCQVPHCGSRHDSHVPYVIHSISPTCPLGVALWAGYPWGLCPMTWTAA